MPREVCVCVCGVPREGWIVCVCGGRAPWKMFPGSSISLNPGGRSLLATRNVPGNYIRDTDFVLLVSACVSY